MLVSYWTLASRLESSTGSRVHPSIRHVRETPDISLIDTVTVSAPRETQRARPKPSLTRGHHQSSGYATDARRASIAAAISISSQQQRCRSQVGSHRVVRYWQAENLRHPPAFESTMAYKAPASAPTHHIHPPGSFTLTTHRQLHVNCPAQEVDHLHGFKPGIISSPASRAALFQQLVRIPRPSVFTQSFRPQSCGVVPISRRQRITGFEKAQLHAYMQVGCVVDCPHWHVCKDLRMIWSVCACVCLRLAREPI